MKREPGPAFERAAGAGARAPVILPAPQVDSGLSLGTALRERRSVRDFAAGALTLQELAQLLWAAQGITHGDGRRTAPSAGALFPLTIYVAATEVVDLPAGVYRYEPIGHSLEPVAPGDCRQALFRASQEQEAVERAAAILVVTAVFSRTTIKYGQRGERYVHAEVGAVAQNVALQVIPLGLGTVYVGAFRDQAVQGALGLPDDVAPLCLLPLGRT